MRTIASKEYVEPRCSPGTVGASLRVGFCGVAKPAVNEIGGKKTRDALGNAPHVLQEGG